MAESMTLVSSSLSEQVRLLHLNLPTLTDENLKSQVQQTHSSGYSPLLRQPLLVRISHIIKPATHFVDSILLMGNAADRDEVMFDRAIPNKNSARGFEVIDAIKTKVEAACSNTVSCADILALAARDGVVLLGGPTWTVELGRRDSRTASLTAANTQIPSPSDNLSTLISLFAAKGLSARDMTALSGSHTIGQARCTNFRARIYNETNIDPNFAATRQANCPPSGGDNNLAPLDIQTPTKFDNDYYQNLVVRRGLLHSDQQLFNGGSQDALVKTYSGNNEAFSSDFTAAVVRMGNIDPLTGTAGEIRKNCRLVN